MAEDVVIRPNSPGDEEPLVELWRAVFNKNRTVEHWKWRFDQCAFGKGVVMMALDGGRIVSAYSTNRIKMKLGEEIVPAVHGFDGYTHVDYRKHGIFTKLLDKLMEDYAAEGTKFMYGYPNTNSYPVHIRLGWKGHGLIDMWEKSLEKYDWSPPSSFETVDAFDERSDELWSKAKHTVPIG
ncbi:MAG: GNAT family N-acetyltransferase, partial [Candidatus Thermoplasmatota archaeon]|nr:GNAT family N-acetyltransferase [Candidatus Thermoplasmatota archaeon]